MSPQAGWILQEEVVPRLRSAISRTVNYVGAEDAEELVQDATVMAAKLMHTVEQQGKTVTPGNIAYYTILHLKSGRRSHGSTSVDACGIATQLNGRSQLQSFDEPVEVDELGGLFTVNDVFANDQEDPAQMAARNLDWETLLGRLTAQEHAIVTALVEGWTVSDVAVAFRMSRSTMQLYKNRLADLIREFMGVDILMEVRRLPGWKSDLNTARAKLACRFDRKH